MEIAEERHDDVLVIAPVGRFDTNTSGRLEDRLRGHLDAGEKRLVIDMLGVDYVSSAGLRVLLMAAKRLQEVGGHLVLCSMNQGVRHVFELAGFLPIFTIEASRDVALARLASEG